MTVFTKSAAFYDALYSWKDYQGEVEKLTAVIRSHVPDARTLLDVACGTGRHLELLSDGYRVEGLDLDAQLLAVARERLPGVPLHSGDMRDFELGRRFDVVTCLFSSIGYVRDDDELDRAIAAMARHLSPGGLMVVEPWFSPEMWNVGQLHALFVDEPELKIVRMHRSDRAGDVAILDMNYMVATARDGVKSFIERHEMTLFHRQDYLDAFRAAGLDVEHDPEGLMGRGLYLGFQPPSTRDQSR